MHSICSGGIELVIYAVFGFIFCSRPKFFYILSVFTIDRGIGCLLKLKYAEPRPYMVNTEMVKAYQCPKDFGSPSLHSSASMAFAIVLSFENVHLLPFCLYWALIIPFSRIVMGAHSFDQVIFGSVLGLWTGFTCNFVLKKPILYHIEKVIQKA